MKIVSEDGVSDNIKVYDNKGNNLIENLFVDSIKIDILPHSLIKATLVCEVESLDCVFWEKAFNKTNLLCSGVEERIN